MNILVVTNLFHSNQRIREPFFEGRVTIYVFRKIYSESWIRYLDIIIMGCLKSNVKIKRGSRNRILIIERIVLLNGGKPIPTKRKRVFPCQFHSKTLSVDENGTNQRLTVY